MLLRSWYLLPPSAFYSETVSDSQESRETAAESQSSPHAWLSRLLAPCLGVTFATINDPMPVHCHSLKFMLFADFLPFASRPPPVPGPRTTFSSSGSSGSSGLRPWLRPSLCFDDPDSGRSAGQVRTARPPAEICLMLFS